MAKGQSGGKPKDKLQGKPKCMPKGKQIQGQAADKLVITILCVDISKIWPHQQQQQHSDSTAECESEVESTETACVKSTQSIIVILH